MTRSQKFRTLIACCALTAALPAAAADAPLGRMFFTPVQRAQLDTARTQRARTTLATDKTEEIQTAAPVPQTITYEGAVRRSDGKSTVFINGRPVHDKEQASGAVIVGRVRADGGVSLQMPQSGRSVDLKPGQSVELLSGAIEEGFSRKTVNPDPKPAAKPSAGETKPAAEPAMSERDREDQQRKVEEAMRTLQEAAAKSGAATPSSSPQTSR